MTTMFWDPAISPCMTLKCRSISSADHSCLGRMGKGCEAPVAKTRAWGTSPIRKEDAFHVEMSSGSLRSAIAFDAPTYVKRDSVGTLKLAFEDDRGRLDGDDPLMDQDVLATGGEKVFLLQPVIDFGFPTGNDGRSKTGDGPVRGGSGVDDHDSMGARELGCELRGDGVTRTRGSDDDNVEHVYLMAMGGGERDELL